MELASIFERHPNLGDGLEPHAVKAIIRLKLDPVALPDDANTRKITVNQRTPATAFNEIEINLEIKWNGFEKWSNDDFLRVMRTSNKEEITEHAAIAVMCLLIHEFESGTINTVLDIGSGGDYLVSIPQSNPQIQIEVSGIRTDPKKKESRSRLNQKCRQVLRNSSSGFASVTTFLYGAKREAMSWLHYVAEPKRPSLSKGKRKRPKKK